MTEKPSFDNELQILRERCRKACEIKRDAKYGSPEWWDALEEYERTSLQATQMERRRQYEGKLEPPTEVRERQVY